MKMRLVAIIALGLLVSACIISSACADEHITSYKSDIIINKDASMYVTETIKVIAENKQIKHGIYRDFPTKYKDKNGNNFVIDFIIKKITRDGSPEPYHTKPMSNGVRIYIGDKKTVVPEGEHTYAITYTTSRQLGFFKEYDELYWNAVGTGWIFSIDKAVAEVTLPPGAPIADVKMQGWTGAQGSTARDISHRAEGARKVVFQTTKPLKAQEGMTISVTWPKGFVDEPTKAAKLRWFFRDMRAVLLLIAGTLVVLAYFLFAYVKVGVDPEQKAIVPQWDPPDALSPAEVRFVSRMGFDNKTLTAAIINIAVKGYISIVKKKRKYSLVRKGDDQSALTTEEADAINAILGNRSSIELNQNNYMRLQAGISKMKKALESRFGKEYFSTNGGHACFGTFLSALVLVGAFMIDPRVWTIVGQEHVPVLMTTLTVITSITIINAVGGWSDAQGIRRKFSALVKALIALIFFAVLIGVMKLVPPTFPLITMVVAIFILIFANMIFYKLLKSYTPKGRELMDRILGLKQYMTIAEQDRLNMLNPPNETPELYESLLPYAIALGVEQRWSEKFADVLKKAQLDGYQPEWYDGHDFTAAGYAGLASSLGSSFSGAIASASNPPGSSSGSDGGSSSGGSSGGGGGGGGGGGW